MNRVVLVGGGFSIEEGIEKGLWDKISKEKVWSCNYAFMTMPFLPEKEIWVDIQFYRHNTEELQALHEKGVKLHTKKHPTYAGVQEYLQLHESTREHQHYYGQEALEKNMLYYGQMGLSGMFALSLAIALKTPEIYLLGYDFGTPSLKDVNTHYYQKDLKHVFSTGMMHPDVYRDPNNEIKSFLNDFKVYLRETDIKIWNVSPNSNIPFFEKINYDQFFERIKDGK